MAESWLNDTNAHTLTYGKTHDLTYALLERIS